MKTIRDNKMCFALGMAMPVVGVVVAAVIRGEDGVKAALLGLAAGVYALACTYWAVGAALS